MCDTKSSRPWRKRKRYCIESNEGGGEGEERGDGGGRGGNVEGREGEREEVSTWTEMMNEPKTQY